VRPVRRPRNRLGLDSEESLEEFVQVLNWLSIVSYTPVIVVMTVVMAAVMLRRVRPEVAAGIFVTLVTLTWIATRWLGHRFLRPAAARDRHIAGRS
jgi:hypothetical protein